MLPSDIIELKARICRRRECGSGPPGAVLDTAMTSFLSLILLPIAVGAVALVLLMGLVNMMRGGSPNRSQKLMRWRVLLQFVAIVITMITVWVMAH
jgi:Hypoxia induced protein conserved region.